MKFVIERTFALARVQIRSFNLNIQYMATSKQTYIHTYTRVLQCSPASVGLTQARPNYAIL